MENVIQGKNHSLFTLFWLPSSFLPSSLTKLKMKSCALLCCALFIHCSHTLTHSLTLSQEQTAYNSQSVSQSLSHSLELFRSLSFCLPFLFVPFVPSPPTRTHTHTYSDHVCVCMDVFCVRRRRQADQLEQDPPTQNDPRYSGIALY